MTFVLYPKLPEEKIRADVPEVVRNIEKWFEENPKRRVCRAGIWYGRTARVRRNHILEDVTTAAEEAINRKA